MEKAKSPENEQIWVIFLLWQVDIFGYIFPTLTVVKKTKAKTPRKYGVLRAFVF